MLGLVGDKSPFHIVSHHNTSQHHKLTADSTCPLAQVSVSVSVSLSECQSMSIPDTFW